MRNSLEVQTCQYLKDIVYFWINFTFHGNRISQEMVLVVAVDIKTLKNYVSPSTILHVDTFSLKRFNKQKMYDNCNMCYNCDMCGIPDFKLIS